MIQKENSVLLETLRRDRDNSRNLLFTNPEKIISCRRPDELEKCFRQMEACRRKGYYLAGFFAYELGYFLEDALKAHCPKFDYPLLWFGACRKPTCPLPRHSGRAQGFFHLSAPRLAARYRPYEKAIRKIKTRIARGETYQINYTTRYDFDFKGNITAFYEEIKKHQQVSYSALIRCDGNAIISLSPELFFRIDAGRRITVKPMKGTAPLSVSGRWLSRDVKNVSENVMIVDLLRNDLGRICLPGSVKVKKLFEVEKYQTLWQMTSTVTGQLQPGIKIYDIIKSLFPCGSVTGAPKIQSMKIISSLEEGPRNIYTGAIGYFAPDGQAVFNVAIRTINLQRKSNDSYSARMGVGGGIVHDSRPGEEYRECRLKGQFLTNNMPAPALIETMLLKDGKIKYLIRHLRRLKASATFFSIPCPHDDIRAALNAYTAGLTGSQRLRLLLQSGGSFTIEHRPVDPRPASLPPVALSRLKTNSEDVFLYHKTTHRKLYDEEYKRYSARGFFDVLFLNEKNEITEGAISNVFIRRRGRWYTPPVSCGLLNGIARQIVMKKLRALEKILYVKNLEEADEMVLTNSVRGVTTVSLERRK